MSLDDRFFCDASNVGLVTTRVDCSFKPAETKRVFFARKGFIIETASTNLNNLEWWEAAIADGNIIPIEDGVFVDVTPNPQEGTVGTKTIKISDGETAVSYKGSFVSCLVRQLNKLESNSSPYDMFVITAIPELIGKYDPEQVTITPIQINSIDVRSKPLFTDGTTVEGIQDTVIIRYNEVQAKSVKYFDINDNIANITGLRAVLIEPISNTPTDLTVKVVTECEGIEVNDLTDTDDITILDNTGAEVAVTSLTGQGGGIYVLETVLTASEVYQIGIPETASNNESYTAAYVDYTAS